jgi:DNA-binding response OmpR family regulator
MKIALTEPDGLLSDLVSFRLELLGHEVTVWECASDMLSQIVAASVDLLIIDNYQPDMSGWEAIQKVRHMLVSDQLPILVLSMDIDLSLVEQAYKSGANDYLITPFDPSVLQQKTDALLLRKRTISRHAG